MKIIEKLRELGWIDQMKDLVKNQNITPAVMEASLEIIFHYDEDAENAWTEYVHNLGIRSLWEEIQKESALDQVDPEALFEKATGKKDPIEKIKNLMNESESFTVTITEPEAVQKFFVFFKGVEK